MSFQEILSTIHRVLHFELFRINDASITFNSILMFVIVFGLFIVFSSLISKYLVGKPLGRLKIDEGLRHVFVRMTHYLVLIIGAVIAFQFIGINLSGLAVILGFLSVGIGFGLQGSVANVIAGFILLFGRPIKVGDRVTVGDKEGDVIDINLRATTIRSLDNISLIVPNSDFVTGTVFNWSHGDRKIRVNVDVGVSYNSDLATVKQVLLDIARENNEVLEYPQPEVLLMAFGNSSWDMRLRVWIANPKRNWDVRSDINCAMVDRFRENGIEIPFPQRDLHLRTPLPLPLQNSSATTH